MLKTLQRLWIFPELLWIGCALALSVTALTSVTFLANRLHLAFEQNAHELLAADAVIQSDQPLPPQFEAQAKQRNLQIAKTVVFPTMASVGDVSKLTSLKAVTLAYPLRGKLVTQKRSDAFARDLPLGHIWLDRAVLQSLDIQIGATLKLGEKSFVVDDVIDQELDRGAAFMNFAPRAMIREEDLSATDLIGLGSRVNYRLLVAAPTGADPNDASKVINDFEVWVKEEIARTNLKGVRLDSLETGQPTMRKTLDRAERFLSLVALLTSMVAAVAIGLTSQRYALKQADVAAVWRCLGASQRQILWSHAKKFIWIALVGGFFGVVLGWVAHLLLLQCVSDLLIKDLPEPSWQPAVWGVLVSLTLFFGFAWAPLLLLSETPPILAFRKDFKRASSKVWRFVAVGFACFSALIFWGAKDPKLGGIVLASFVGGGFIFLVAGYGLSQLFGRWLSGIEHLKPGIRLAAMRLMGRPWMTALQIASLGIALMALMMLLVVRSDLLNAWQASVPENAPNRFIVNIQPDQKEDVRSRLLEKATAGDIDFYPMVRGRLIEVNGKPVSSANYVDDNAQRLIDREFNLSYSDTLPLKNKVIAGTWLSERTEDIHQVSMESGIMKTLHLRLNDQLTFDIAGQVYQVKITSIRKLDWSSMRVNFFAILPKKLLEQAPQTWITAYRQASESRIDLDLVKSYPNLTVVDVEASLKQAQAILSQLSMAIQLLFGFTVLAGMFVLATALASTQNERMRESAILKTMGANQDFLSRAWRVELLFIGALSGFLGGLIASISGWIIAKYVLEIEMAFPIMVIAVGTILGATLSWLSGYWLRSKILNVAPIVIMRES